MLIVTLRVIMLTYRAENRTLRVKLKCNSHTCPWDDWTFWEIITSVLLSHDYHVHNVRVVQGAEEQHPTSHSKF